jgi:hypothetical protein
MYWHSSRIHHERSLKRRRIVANRTGSFRMAFRSNSVGEAGYDYRPTGASPVETNSAVRRGETPSKRTASQGETKKRRGHHAARPKGHHAARPRGALIETRKRTPTQRRHHVACPRGAMIRSYTPLSDQHPTGTSPDVMASSLGSHAGYDYRSTGASPVETNTAVRRGETPSKRTPPSDGDKSRRNEQRLKARLRNEEVTTRLAQKATTRLAQKATTRLARVEP